MSCRPLGARVSDNAALVLVDHQVGLLTGVRDITVAELKNNVVSLAKAMRIRLKRGQERSSTLTACPSLPREARITHCTR